MRICIPTENKEGLNSRVCGHFGSAPYFTIYDTDKGTLETVDNTNARHSHGLCHPVGALSASSLDAVVCQGMGIRALQKLSEANIKAYRVQAGTVAEIIKEYGENELEEMTVQKACAQHGCRQQRSRIAEPAVMISTGDAARTASGGGSRAHSQIKETSSCSRR